MPQNEIKRLTERHRVIMDLHLSGLSHVQIAQEMGMTPQGVGLVVRSPQFQHEVARRRDQVERDVDQQRVSRVDEARAALEENSLAAATTLVGGLSSDDERIQHSSAKEILDRVMGKRDDASARPQLIIDADRLTLLQVTLKESLEG